MTVFAARPRRALGLALWVALCGAPRVAHAVPPSAALSAPALTEAQLEAQDHYKHALELYRVGSYREAAAELEAALVLDPNAKELVFNLGVVSEKLGKFDDALRHFRRYAEMNLSPAEKQRADGLIRRLEGAKQEVVPPPPAPSAPPPSKSAEKPENGRIDAATLVAASIAVVGLGVGTAFGIKAFADKPRSDFVTGRDGTYADLERSADRSHAEAVVADVGFGVGVAGAAVAAYLYLSRSKTAAASPPPSAISVTPTAGGGTIFLRGSF